MSLDWHQFVPANARGVVDDIVGAPALLSGLLLSHHAPAISCPVVEVSICRGAVLAGFFRACRQADAVAVVAVDAALRRRHPAAGEHIVRGVAAAAALAHHDRPIVLAARANVGVHLGSVGSAVDSDDDRLTSIGEQLARDVGAGFGAIAIDAASIVDADVLERAIRLVRELELGIELEVDVGVDAALLLASIDDRGLPISAVRGAGHLDDVGAASRVIAIGDLGGLDGLDPGGLRVNIDAIFAAISGSDDEVEVRSWMAASRVLRALKADGSASRLADALQPGDPP